MDGRGIHEVEMDNVIDAHCFQRQNHVAEVSSLDLGDGSRQHLVLERIFGV